MSNWDAPFTPYSRPTLLACFGHTARAYIDLGKIAARIAISYRYHWREL